MLMPGDNFISIDKYKIHYQILGSLSDAAPIVFLHEGLGSIPQWKNFPRKLHEATRLACIVYERRGYGKSSPYSFLKDQNYLHKEADFLIKILDQLGVSECSLFGHSDGATIALIAGGNYPSRVKAIISEAPHVVIEEQSIAGIKDAIASYDKKLKPPLAKYHGTKTDTIFEAWSQTWIDPAFKAWNCLKDLEMIECAVFALQGELDQYATRQQMHLLQKHVSRCQSLIISDVKHMPHFDAEQIVIKSTSNFLLS